MSERQRFAFKAQLEPDLVEMKTHDGQEYICAPCVAIVPGVLNEALVPLSVIEQTANAWNGAPIVINHPMNDEGVAISANDPDILANAGIGRLWYAGINEGRLKVEAWIDVSKANELGGDATVITDRLKNHEAIEVSTGYWAVTREQKGVFNERDYTETTELIIPDHLAFLPNDIGACNWSDGCGVPRTNQALVDGGDPSWYEQFMAGIQSLSKIVKSSDDNRHPHDLATNLTVTDQFIILARLVAIEMEEAGVELWRWYIEDIEDGTVIMWHDGKLMRRPFERSETDDLRLVGEWEEVNRKTTFTSAAGHCQCGGLQSSDLTKGDLLVAEETNQPVDTLAEFLNQHGMTQAALDAAIKSRADARSQAIDRILQHSQVDRAQLELLDDTTLQALASQQLAPAIDGIEGKQVTPDDFVGRGEPAIVQPPQSVPPRPRVLRKSA